MRLLPRLQRARRVERTGPDAVGRWCRPTRTASSSASSCAAGRPDKGMPKFEHALARDVVDIATFLHSAIYLNANRRLYKILDIVVGDAKAGEAFFNGAGQCSACHRQPAI